MEDEIVLKQPLDRRLADDSVVLPPGPPGAENDNDFNDLINKNDKFSATSFKIQRRSSSPLNSNRKSISKGQPRSSRSRRSSPRRYFPRGRNNFSPDRRRFNDRPHIRRSLKRNRSRNRTDQIHRRDRSVGKRDSHSLSKSPISRNRWSPKKKLNSPVDIPSDKNFNIVDTEMYSNAFTTYNKYRPQPYVEPSTQLTFLAGYPPPPAWEVHSESYQQRHWVPQPMTSSIVQQTLLQEAKNVDKDNIAPTQEAVAQEAENQRDELKKQRTSYLKKIAALKKEFKALKDQKKDLIEGSGSRSPTTKGFLDENERLQNQIQKKMCTIENVIDMLTGIIGEDNCLENAVKSAKNNFNKKRALSSSSSDDSSTSNSTSSSSSTTNSDIEEKTSTEYLKCRTTESIKDKSSEENIESKYNNNKDDFKKSNEKKVNYVFYDPEMHWCKICGLFPKTAKDYLTHLHSKEHTKNVQIMETPWHDALISDEYTAFEGVPTKRIPIRGLMFFVPATAWYCQICSIWMGDLHCASLHLKSKIHSNKYNVFLEKNPNFEEHWLAERQKRFSDNKIELETDLKISNITTLSGTDNVETKDVQSNFKKLEEKERNLKKRKKKQSDKKDKKKKKRPKKRKKASISTCSHDSSSEIEAKNAKYKQTANSSSFEPVASSIRVEMRKLQKEKDEKEMHILATPPPPKISEFSHVNITAVENIKKDDLLSQWNNVQSVISENEKKLLEKLKGKLKNRPAEIDKNKIEEKLIIQFPSEQNLKANVKKNVIDQKHHIHNPIKNEKEKRDTNRLRRRKSRSRSFSFERVRKERSQSRTFDHRRSRSRGRKSSSRARHTSRVHSKYRRSRSIGRKRSPSHRRSRHHPTLLRSRSRSGSNLRIEKAIIRQSEFRPRVPVIDNNSVKKNKHKTVEENDSLKKNLSKSSMSNRKLPFIGRMPVFKKHPQNSESLEIEENIESEKKNNENKEQTILDQSIEVKAVAQDNYVHAGYEPSLMSEYEDLMPDPVQFVTLMGAPPPPPLEPPPQKYVEDENDILPPGIDETESDFVPRPISDAPIPREGPLPKDFEEALNIIFPGEKSPGGSKTAKLTEQKEIIINEPVMQRSDLLKEGIHLITIEETSLVSMDEVSEISMNEPLQFNKSKLNLAVPSPTETAKRSEEEKIPSLIDVIKEAAPICSLAISNPPSTQEQIKNLPTSNKEYESPTYNEKSRCQEELDDLALLGIDADDMAAMCI